ncbi:MAG: hypothetical protein JOY91_14225 [Sinobacteraceae bacterium]|nr:hypothetical protein [Nevskiaceae bacterium]
MNPQREIEDLIARFYAAFDNREGRVIGVDELRRMFLADARINARAGGPGRYVDCRGVHCAARLHAH